MSLILRKAEKKDADEIAKIEAERFSKPWSKASVLSEIENPSSVVICAETDGEIVGYGGLQTVLDEGYITNIAVRKKNERKGIASAIVEAIIGSAKERKLSFVSLEVRESNFAAQGLYLKYGFEIVGKRTNFYEKPAEDALIMTKNL
ncbi:MAG: ribosomal protein S18-alanine N-acetyltransferase [Oscillospiraceae bacterium]|nr:ribosomal protein S18-alanine N-acetyltransferase [Oscillospiraceae bacterium]